jgi:hypothetical protein
MRTDIILSRRRVKATHLRPGPCWIKPGNWIAYDDQECGRHAYARVIATITWAPNINLDVSGHEKIEHAIRDWLLVISLSPRMDSAYERWVNPRWVVQLLDEPPHHMLSWITQPKIPYSTDIIRQLMNTGYLHERFMERVHTRASELIKRGRKKGKAA